MSTFFKSEISTIMYKGYLNACYRLNKPNPILKENYKILHTPLQVHHKREDLM